MGLEEFEDFQHVRKYSVFKVWIQKEESYKCNKRCLEITKNVSFEFLH